MTCIHTLLYVTVYTLYINKLANQGPGIVSSPGPASAPAGDDLPDAAIAASARDCAASSWALVAAASLAPARLRATSQLRSATLTKIIPA